MKKFTALMLALMMSLSLVACGNKPCLLYTSDAADE